MSNRYLKEVVVKDLQTGVVWHCLCNKWLSMTEGRGTLAVVVAMEDETYAKEHFYQFMQTSSRDIRNGHIWISVFTKSANSNFTHVQRLTCALAILMATMLTNIMFHGIARGDPEHHIGYGDFHFLLADIMIGIESSLIVFPINLVIILMFEHTKPKQNMVIKADEIQERYSFSEKNKKAFRYMI